MKTLYLRIVSFLDKKHFLPLLFFRLILAYVFFHPALYKISNYSDLAASFAALNIPFPALAGFISVVTECSGIILLFLGLGTRIICIPLLFLLTVAIITVHASNGYACSNNGFEVPLYCMLMLFCLLIMGPGSISLDSWIENKLRKAGKLK